MPDKTVEYEIKGTSDSGGRFTVEKVNTNQALGQIEEKQISDQKAPKDNSRVYDLTKVSGDNGYVPGPVPKGSAQEARILKDLNAPRPDLKASPSQSKINH